MNSIGTTSTYAACRPVLSADDNDRSFPRLQRVAMRIISSGGFFSYDTPRPLPGGPSCLAGRVSEWAALPQQDSYEQEKHHRDHAYHDD